MAEGVRLPAKLTWCPPPAPPPAAAAAELKGLTTPTAAAAAAGAGETAAFIFVLMSAVEGTYFSKAELVEGRIGSGEWSTERRPPPPLPRPPPPPPPRPGLEPVLSWICKRILVGDTNSVAVYH